MQGKFYKEAEDYIREIFWQETHDKSCGLDLEKLITSKLISDDQEKDPAYYNVRPGVVHVSSLSKCLRGVVHEMLGHPKTTPVEARKLGVFKAGQLFEEFIIDSLGERILNRQTEYICKYKNIYLTGRDDGLMETEEGLRILEVKSVHSDSFWMREREGTLVATHNQMQLQTYLHLRRTLPSVFLVNGKDIVYTNMSMMEVLEFKNAETISTLENNIDSSQLQGYFSYISKDDCTVSGVPVRYNPNIIAETIKPALDFIAEAYARQDPNFAPLPEAVVYNDTKHQWQKNWIATYCEYHDHCAGEGWLLEATKLVTAKNKEMKDRAAFPEVVKKVKPTITVVSPDNQPLI